MRVFAILLTLTVIHTSSAASLSWWRSLIGSEEEESASQPPAFCQGYECPDYVVVQQFDGYEERRYEESKWARVALPAMKSEFWEDTSGTSSTFRKLYRYITGSNDRGQKMDMTVPVLMTHTIDTVYMSFMVPKQFADNVPQPNDTSIRVIDAPAGSFYVKSYGGWQYGLFGYNYGKDHQQQLLEEVERDNNQVDDTMFFTAGYNSPWQLRNRHNEVWLVKK